MKEGKIGRIIFSRIFEDEDLLEGIKERVEESNVKAGLLFLIGSLKGGLLGLLRGR